MSLIWKDLRFRFGVKTFGECQLRLDKCNRSNQIFWISKSTTALNNQQQHQHQQPYLRPPLPPSTTTTTTTPSSFYQNFLINNFHSSKALDQINQLSISIAANDLKTSISIIHQIELSLGYVRHPRPSTSKLSHSLEPRVTRINHHSHSINLLPTLNQVIQRPILNSLLRRFLVNAQTDESFEDLTFEWMMNFRTNGSAWAEIDHHTLASIFKGLLFLKNPRYSVLDYMPWVIPDAKSDEFSFRVNSNNGDGSISKPPSLRNIFDSIIFSVSDRDSFFGRLEKAEALKKIKHLATEAGRTDVLDEISTVEQYWEKNQSDLINQPDVKDTWKDGYKALNQNNFILNPVTKPLKPTDDPLSERQVPLRLSSLLSTVSTIKQSSPSKSLVEDQYDRQLLLEYSGYDSAEAEWYEGHKKLRSIKEQEVSLDENDCKYDYGEGKVLKAWMWDWWNELRVWFDDLLKDPSKRPSIRGRKGVGISDVDLSFVKVLNSSLISKVAVVEVIREMTNSTITDGSKSIGLLISLGKSIENEFYVQSIKSIPELNSKLLRSIKNSLDPLNSSQGFEPRTEKEGDETDEGIKSNLINHSIRSIWRREVEAYSNELKALNGERFDWTIHQRAKVGALLMRGLLETSKIKRSKVLKDGSIYEEIQPAFYQTTQYFDGKRVGVTKMNEAVAERLDRDPANVTLHPRYLPMVCLPLPWTNPKSGAYLVHGAPLMRTKDSLEQILHLQESHRSKSLDRVIYRALDKLGSTAWCINKEIFEVMVKVWNSGIELAGIPIRDPHLNLNIENHTKSKKNRDNSNTTQIDSADDGDCDEIFSEKKESCSGDDPRSEGERKEIYRSLLASRRSAYGQRCSVNYQLEIAKAYLDEKFYFPHNIDFRGRAYPIPTNLNHIGDDISRGLLKFDESKKLGSRGLFWLKVHISNKFGNDKVSLTERERFIDGHLEEIFDSADRPLDGKGWWLKSDDPWQTLAGCIELTKALRLRDSQGNPVTPEEYRSNLPIHQDGSCNGLQHYAALGGDIEGGKQVNLFRLEGDEDRPGDVYSKVADEVNKLIEMDCSNGHDIAKALRGHVKRKVVKQTVMTTVYGVTFVGAREQIKKQLKELNVIPIPNLYISSAYVATLVMRSIGEVFKGAVGIQTWLTFVARIVSKSIPPERLDQGEVEPEEDNLDLDVDNRKSKSGKIEEKTKVKSLGINKVDDEKQLMTSMTWTTPLGLVVCQPYRTQNRTQISTVLQTVYISDPNEPNQTDSRSQSTAFPPNFIHSLDSCHMMITALACKDITFASVHDSYWTHGGDIDFMNVKLRESFVKLHKTEILKNLSDEIKVRYEGYKVPKSVLTAKMMSDLKKMGIKKDVLYESQQEEEEEGGEKDEDKKAEKKKVKGDSKRDCKTKRPVTKRRKRTKGSDKKYYDLVDLIPELPAKGKLNIEDVIRSTYFFA
ncbi:hypothetical protein PPACK8108_LOCUS9070 [Phakopsora pachyrhizi]|uniref:DNA-directed RNA polymerase n=1 Tax=Phakopsora pachyrhizi TaxID=170000 RepID=A0AAV0AYJ4_PHAPC|nr:hypothetical protein PPACK8108_LOCUS9070 [Phakopsora pachyrhizi]